MPENNSPRLSKRAEVALVTSQWVLLLEGAQESIASPSTLGASRGPLGLSQSEKTCSKCSRNADLTSQALRSAQQPGLS